MKMTTFQKALRWKLEESVVPVEIDVPVTPPPGTAQLGYAQVGSSPQGYAPQGYAPQGYAPQGYGSNFGQQQKGNDVYVQSSLPGPIQISSPAQLALREEAP